MKTPGRIFACIGLCVAALPFLALMVLFGQLLPLPSTLIAVALAGTAAVWFWLRKSRGAVVSESGLMGRQTSKDGLL